VTSIIVNLILLQALLKSGWMNISEGAADGKSSSEVK
jgi:hypothetical protein